MATDLGLLSLTQLQKLAQSQHQNQSAPNRTLATGSWMWSPKLQSGSAQTIAQDDDDSWEVRAFEEDTNQAMGTTWPPRSYTCTFCMREFKSAQALGGHMNVHRRDRARLHHQVQPGLKTSSLRGDVNSPTIIFPTQEYMKNGGVCILYALPNPSSGGANGGTNNPYSNLAMTGYQPNNIESHYPASIDFSVLSRSSINSSQSGSSNMEPSASASVGYSNFQVFNGSPLEDLDLELRLGRNSSRS